MAIGVITVDRDQKAGVMPLVWGFWVTLKNFFGALFLKRASTVQVPEEKRPVSSRYRGIHILTEREDGSPKCVACYMCATVCPAECIYIEAGERPEKTFQVIHATGETRDPLPDPPLMASVASLSGGRMLDLTEQDV